MRMPNRVARQYKPVVNAVTFFLDLGTGRDMVTAFTKEANR